MPEDAASFIINGKFTSKVYKATVIYLVLQWRAGVIHLLPQSINFLHIYIQEFSTVSSITPKDEVLSPKDGVTQAQRWGPQPQGCGYLTPTMGYSTPRMRLPNPKNEVTQPQR